MGKWHLISLNGNCKSTGVGGCGASSAQTQWLSADLAANNQPCTLAYWHQPEWTATASNNATAYATWWSMLYASHVDLVLNGHVHTYARFALLNPSGATDAANGVREVIVGTGGESLVSTAANATPAPLATFRGFGYLRMVLHPTGYDAQFIDATGAVKDTFSGTCHGTTPPPPGSEFPRRRRPPCRRTRARPTRSRSRIRARPTRRTSPSPTTRRRTRSPSPPRRRAGAAPVRARSRATWGRSAG